jgi:hypothetical protein
LIFLVGDDLEPIELVVTGVGRYGLCRPASRTCNPSFMRVDDKPVMWSFFLLVYKEGVYKPTTETRQKM